MSSPMHDVAIVGAGSAGLSAAVTLARSLRSVVVIDSGEPRNAPSLGAHNVLAREGIAPSELLAIGRQDAEAYGAEVIPDRVAAARRNGSAFELDTARGGLVRARRLLLATGLRDVLPEIPGVRTLWGKSVLHCPYCHGWEVRGQRIAVLATTERSVHQALLFRQLSSNVTFLSHTLPPLDADAVEKLAARHIPIVDGLVDRLVMDDDALRSVVLEDGRTYPVDAVAVAPRFVARAEVYEQLGGEVTDHPFGTYVRTDHTGRTAVPGVYAAGNVSDLAAMVAAASGAGVMVAAAINADLVDEDVRIAVGRPPADDLRSANSSR